MIFLLNKKFIKDKKNSVKYAYKITKSMEMISISKFQNLFKNLNINRIYNHFLTNLIRKKLNLYYVDHIFVEKVFNLNKIDRKINILYIVIATDQGLCGNINFSLFNQLIIKISKKTFFYKKLYFFLIGKKNISFINILKKKKISFILIDKIYSLKEYTNNTSIVNEKIISFFKLKKPIKIYVVNNSYVNKKIFSFKIKDLLPITCSFKKNYDFFLNYVYEYKKKEKLINFIFYKYIDSVLYNSVLENMVFEYSTRMLIMKNAAKNADNLYKELDILYNKIRQFNITKEITELVSSLDIF